MIHIALDRAQTLRMAVLCAALGFAPLTLAADSWGTKAEVLNLNCTSADCSGGGSSGGDSIRHSDHKLAKRVLGQPASNEGIQPPISLNNLHEPRFWLYFGGSI